MIEKLQIAAWLWAWTFGIWIGLCIGYEIWGRKHQISETLNLQEMLLLREKK